MSWSQIVFAFLYCKKKLCKDLFGTILIVAILTVQVVFTFCAFLTQVSIFLDTNLGSNNSSNNEKSLLCNKTRLWVTNNLSFLPYADHIIVMENGSILDQGSFQELKEKKTLRNLPISQQELANTEDSATEEKGVVAKEEKTIKRSNAGSIDSKDKKSQLIKTETAETGRVQWKVYLSYFKSLSYIYTIIFVATIALQESLHLMGNIWLANWSDANAATENENDEVKDVSYYLWGYAIIGISEMVIKLGNDLTYFFR